MTDAVARFRASLSEPEPPASLPVAAQALWWEAKGDWARAHDCAQRDEGRRGAAVHAYLHRKEGDLANARYWYARAGRPQAACPLETEWESLVREMAQEESQ